MYKQLPFKLIISALCLLSITTQAQNVFPTPSGSVGIGINPPSALLHVHNSSSLGTTAGSTIEVARFSGVNVNISQLRLQLNRYAAGNDWYSASMRLQHVIDYTNAGYIEFDPVNGNAGVAIGSASTEIARFLNTGVVGIGTTSPAAGSRLDVAGSIYTGSGNVNGNTTKMFVRNPAGKTWAISSGLNMLNENDFGIYNWTDNSTSPLFNIASNGKVGIGVTGPGGFLHIKGNTTNNSPDIILESSNSQAKWQMVSIQANGNFAIADISNGGSNNTTPFVINKGAPNNTVNITNNGNVCINMNPQPNTNYKLDVGGWMRANKVVVNTTGADFVFDSSYNLRPLSEVETYIGFNKHLPDIAPAADMQREGLDLGDNQTKLLQKVEELTLYLIEQNKKIELLHKEIADLKKAVKK